jgi:hypothetical protein
MCSAASARPRELPRDVDAPPSLAQIASIATSSARIAITRRSAGSDVMTTNRFLKTCARKCRTGSNLLGDAFRGQAADTDREKSAGRVLEVIDGDYPDASCAP